LKDLVERRAYESMQNGNKKKKRKDIDRKETCIPKNKWSFPDHAAV